MFEDVQTLLDQNERYIKHTWLMTKGLREVVVDAAVRTWSLDVLTFDQPIDLNKMIEWKMFRRS